jgi:methionine synthase II (cobalamin-independent)
MELKYGIEEGVSETERKNMEKIGNAIEKVVKRYRQNAEVELHLDKNSAYRIELVFKDFAHFDDVLMALENLDYGIVDMNIKTTYENFSAEILVNIWI